jgi:hypothetical protein
MGNREKVAQCLEKYPSLGGNTGWGRYQVMQELAVSALLGSQIDYYQEIQQETEKTIQIANALGIGISKALN